MDNEKKSYLRKNIEQVNASNFELSAEGLALFVSKNRMNTEMKKYMFEALESASLVADILREFHELNYVKSKIVLIANKYLFRKSDLTSFLEDKVLEKIIHKVDRSIYVDNSSKVIQEAGGLIGYGFIKTRLNKIIDKQFDFLKTYGFPSNIVHKNAGVMTADAGDSAQFLFIARAILAGYNCSNVDVRSSRYDAVIDFEGRILRVQVKGISGGSVIQFKDRDRGGEGIDHKHERNKGQRITSSDCDLYVAVDKEVGMCYLIPMKDYVDELSDEGLSVNLKDLTGFKENWGVISSLSI